MSGSMAVGANYLSFTAGGAAAAGSGPYTLAILVQPGAGNNNAGLMALLNAGTMRRAFFEDTLKLFGEGDFSGGTGTLTQGSWYLLIESKGVGADLYEFDIWPYDPTGAGVMTSGTNTGTHGDGAAVTEIRIGQAIDNANGLYAVAGIWNRKLSPAERQSMKSSHLSAWTGVAGGPPAELISLQNWTGTTGATIVVGTSTFSAVVGAVGAGANPPSFDFSIGVTIADSSGGAGTAGTTDGLALGDGSGAAGTGGTSDGLALGDGSGGAGTAGTTDGLALGDASGGAGTSGTTDGLALADSSGGAGTGGSLDTIPGAVVFADSSGGAGTGGSPDTVSGSPLVVHDLMVMPILRNARACLVTEVGKLAFPPARVQIRPGTTFEFQADAFVNECCEGIAWVRRGTLTPTDGKWPHQLAEPSKNRPGQYAVQLELGIERCIPLAADAAGGVVTTAQWDQAVINSEDDGAALRRAVCSLRAIYGADSIIENPTVPLENGGMCGGQILTVTVRAPACECVG